jgi:hypothetical protein
VELSDGAAAELSPSARSRARSRLRNLLIQVSAARIWEASGLIAHALQSRAERATFSASSLDLEDVLRDERVQLSGVSLPGSGISAGDLVEGYVFSHDLDALERDCLLSPASRSRANVILHVVRSEAKHPAMKALADVVGSPLALAADLAEHDGVRERYQAMRCLDDLHAAFLPDIGAAVHD